MFFICMCSCSLCGGSCVLIFEHCYLVILNNLLIPFNIFLFDNYYYIKKIV